MRILVTGGCGFIGSNFIRHLLNSYPDYEIINFDALTYAGNPYNLADITGNDRYSLIQGRIEDQELVTKVFRTCDWVVNFAAERHVDGSVSNAFPFLQTNVIGLQTLIQAAKRSDVERFLHISTNEVYGYLESDGGKFSEETPLAPNSPFSASKASGDMLLRASIDTHGIPVLIIRPSKNFGPFQNPDKFIPLMITSCIDNKPFPVCGEGKNVRDWIFVEDTVRAIDVILHRGKTGEVYNIGGEEEVRDIDLAEMILYLMGKDGKLLKFIPDRPDHGHRRALDNTKIHTNLGWKNSTGFREGVERTIEWYRKNEWWWRPLKARLS